MVSEQDGEIDCMEVMGQETNKAYGTIHYGNPHSESQGTYTIKDGADFSDDFHTFTCDWEPGKITWYVDGNKYHEESGPVLNNSRTGNTYISGTI